MARHDPGERPSRVLSWPAPPPLDLLQAAAGCGGPACLQELAAGLWRVARDTAGQVDREVTTGLLLGACHLLSDLVANEQAEYGLAQLAFETAARAREVLRERRPVDVDELLRVAWALSELEALPAVLAVTVRRSSAQRGGAR